MSTEYYASFEPASMSRQEIAYKISEGIFALGARVDVDFDRLDKEDGRYVPTHDYLEKDSLIQAIQATEHWHGIQLHMTYEKRMCDITLINDISDKVTLIFSEPKSLYNQQLQNETDLSLLKVLLIWNRLLGSSFCIFEPGWIGKSRVMDDIKEWIRDLDEGRSRDWELVIVADREIAFVSIPSKVRERYSFNRLEELGIWYFSIK